MKKTNQKALLLLAGMMGASCAFAPLLAHAQDTKPLREEPEKTSIDKNNQEDVIQKQQVQTTSKQTALQKANMLRTTNAKITEGIKIDEKNFPDPWFRAWVDTTYGENGVLPYGVISGVREINISNLGIENLTGIENFKFLEKLRCDLNKLTSINLGKNKNISYLDCDGNVSLTTLNLLGNEKLDTLHCNFNSNLKELNLQTNQALTTLTCQGLAVATLDLSNHAALTYVDCSEGSLNALDISGNTSLEMLNCRNNNLTSIAMSQTPALKQLICSNNDLSLLDTSSSIALERLYCVNNRLKSLDLSGNPALIALDCSSNNLELNSLNIKNNLMLEILDCSHNELQRLNVENNKALTTLDCSWNAIISLDVRQNLKLVDLNCNYNGFLYLHLSNQVTYNNLDFGSQYQAYLFNENDSGNNTIDLNKYIPGIEAKNIHDVKGAKQEGAVFSDFTSNQITYTYDCGQGKSIDVLFYVRRSNNWIGNLQITDWNYGQTANTPVMEAKYGTPEFLYSDTIDGTYEALPQQPHAGTWYVKAYVSSTTEYSGLESEPVAFTIHKIKGIGSVILNDWTYGETASKPIVKSDTNGVEHVTYLYKVRDAEDTTYTNVKPSDAGTYTVKAIFKTTDNYKEVESTSDFTIHKANGSASLSIENWGYKEPSSKPVVTTTNDMKNVTYFYKGMNEDDSKYTQDTPTEIGKYTIKAIFKETKNYTVAEATADFEITKGHGSVSLFMKDWTYGDTSSLPTLQSKTHDTKTAVFMYKVKGASDDTYTTTMPKNPGSYVIKVHINGNSYYEGLTILQDFTIHKALGSAKVELDDWVYNSKAQTVKAESTTNGIDNVTYLYKVKGSADSTYTTTMPVDANDYTLKAVFKKTKYYQEVIAYKDFKIAKADNTFTADMKVQGWTYGDSIISPHVSAKNGNVKYVYSNRIDGEYTTKIPTSAGIWYVKAMVPESMNYKYLISQPKVFQIAAKNVSSLQIPNINEKTDIKSIVIKDGEKVLVNGIDYNIEKMLNGKNTIMTITFKGNYHGVVNKSYTATAQERNELKQQDVVTGDETTKGIWISLSGLSIFGLIVLSKKKQQEK